MVLQLPPALCAERAAARVGHEGGVGGPGAKRVTYNMAAQIRNAGPPSAPVEGIASVMVRARRGVPCLHSMPAAHAAGTKASVAERISPRRQPDML